MKANVNSSWGKTYLKYSPGPGTKKNEIFVCVWLYMHLESLSNNSSLVLCKVKRKKKTLSGKKKSSQCQFDEVD